MKRAIGFEDAAVEKDMGAIAEDSLCGADRAREGSAIALQARFVPDELSSGGQFLELRSLSFAQAYGRNLVRFE